MQLDWSLAIDDALFVARLDTEPLLRGTDQSDVARFAIGTRYRIGSNQRHQQEECPRHDADWNLR